jgi:hypothetical protein
MLVRIVLPYAVCTITHSGLSSHRRSRHRNDCHAPLQQAAYRKVYLVIFPGSMCLVHKEHAKLLTVNGISVNMLVTRSFLRVSRIFWWSITEKRGSIMLNRLQEAA